MRKLRTLIFISLIPFSFCYSQTNEKIVTYFKSRKVINLEHCLFTSNELISLCKDSIGKEKFKISVLWLNNYLKSANEEEATEKKVLIYLIKKNINQLKITDEKSLKSKAYIQQTLGEVNENFKIDEMYLYKRFNTTDDISYCGSCISMYIFFIYNPELYVKVRSKERNFLQSQVHFPLAYILQDCNTPIEIAAKIQVGLIEILKRYNDPLLEKMSIEISKCDITNRCD